MTLYYHYCMADNRFRTGRHVIYDLHAHIVLTPKYRRKVITPRVRDLLTELATDICHQRDVTLDAIDGTDDHLHLLVSYPPKVRLSDLVRDLKAITSKELRAKNWPEITRALWGEHFWSPSYCVTSAGGAPLDIIKTYVDNQRAEPKGPGRPRARA